MGDRLDAWLSITWLYGTTFIFHVLFCAWNNKNNNKRKKKIVGYCCDNETFEPLEYGNSLNGIYVLIIQIGMFFLYYNYQMVPGIELNDEIKEGKIFVLRNTWYYVECANFFGLFFSYVLYFWYRDTREKYSRCVTLDQVERIFKDKQDQDQKRKDCYRLKIPKTTITTTTTKTTEEAVTSKSFLKDIFLGLKWNPRISLPVFLGCDGGVVNEIDLKMFLYIVGAVGLEWNVLSCCCCVYHYYGFCDDDITKISSNAMMTYFLCFQWFVFDYMYHEKVHLFTYDLFAEKVGFKLCWGCLVFYPFFYPIGGLYYLSSKQKSTFSSEEEADDISFTTMLLILALFFTGWIITRGANMQKYEYRVHALQKLHPHLNLSHYYHDGNDDDSSLNNPNYFTFLFGLIQIKQETIPNTRILVSGFWGVSRHFNYFGEIIQSIATTLPIFLVMMKEQEQKEEKDSYDLTMLLIPWLYPIYYIILFVTRQIDDDQVCSNKYGPVVWNQYKRMVPFRIIPGIY